MRYCRYSSGSLRSRPASPSGERVERAGDPAGGRQNRVAARDVTARREVGHHGAGKRGGAAHIGGRGRRGIDLHDVERAGLERAHGRGRWPRQHHVGRQPAGGAYHRGWRGRFQRSTDWRRQRDIDPDQRWRLPRSRSGDRSRSGGTPRRDECPRQSRTLSISASRDRTSPQRSQRGGARRCRHALAGRAQRRGSARYRCRRSNFAHPKRRFDFGSRQPCKRSRRFAVVAINSCRCYRLG